MSVPCSFPLSCERAVDRVNIFHEAAAVWRVACGVCVAGTVAGWRGWQAAAEG